MRYDRLKQSLAEFMRGLFGVYVVPSVDHLGKYDAKVLSQSADLTKIDVMPIDTRIGGADGIPNVPLRLPAGMTIQLAQGALVLVGWIGGNPQLPYAEPAFDPSATATAITLKAGTVFLGDSSGAQFVALANLVDSRLQAIYTAISTAAVVANDGGAALKANIITYLAAHGWPVGTLTTTAATKTKAV